MSHIYHSPLPALSPIPTCSTFSYAFPEPDPYPPNTPAFIDAPTGHTLTRASIRSLALRLAYALRTRLALPRGSTVLLFSPNALAFPIALYGAGTAGLRVSLANATYTASELAYQVKDSGAQIVFAHPALVRVTLAALADLGYSEDDARTRCVVLDYAGLSGLPAPAGHLALDDLLRLGTLEREERFDGEDADEAAFLCYSSGTTGRAKGVMVRHLRVLWRALLTPSLRVCVWG